MYNYGFSCTKKVPSIKPTKCYPNWVYITIISKKFWDVKMTEKVDLNFPVNTVNDDFTITVPLL